MLQDEIKTMLKFLIENRKNFRKFYKNGYFEYSKDNTFEGSVAIINNDTIVSFLKYINDDSKAIATIDFQNNGTIILNLFDDDFSMHNFGMKTFTNSYSSRIIPPTHDDIVKKISYIIKCCEKAKKSHSTFQYKNIFNIKKHQSLSKKEIHSLLENTLNKLNKTKSLNEKNDIVPKFNISPVSNKNVSISTPNIDRSR